MYLVNKADNDLNNLTPDEVEELKLLIQQVMAILQPIMEKFIQTLNENFSLAWRAINDWWQGLTPEQQELLSGADKMVVGPQLANQLLREDLHSRNLPIPASHTVIGKASDQQFGQYL